MCHVLKARVSMRYLAILLSVACTVVSVGAVQAEKRVAFVVGNGTTCRRAS